jgi:GTPase SAR1 family protein
MRSASFQIRDVEDLKCLHTLPLCQKTCVQSLTIFEITLYATDITALGISLSHMTALQTSLSHLTTLQTLNIGNNYIGAEGAVALVECVGACVQNLDMSNCRIEGILCCDFSRFVKLRTFNVAVNQLTSVDLSLFVLPRLLKCELGRNPNLKQPPLFEVAGGLPRLREYAKCEKETFDKLVLAVVGKEGVGKTVLTYRLMGMDDEAERYLAFDRDGGGRESHRGETRGVHHEDWVIESTGDYTSHHDGRLELTVWDYAGQSGYRGLHQCFFSRQAVYLLVFDLTKDAEESGRELCSWVRSIHSCVSGPVFCVVGTKLDKMRGRESEARLRYKRVIECLHEYRQQWREALQKHVYSNRQNWRYDTRSSVNELLHRDICLPDVPRRSSDVDGWLVECKETIGTVESLRTALVDFIERQAKCETNSYFPHLHQP